jgi:hypothetical protein
VSPGISMAFSADRTLPSSKRPRNLCDVFLIVMQQQYARSFTKGKIVLAHPETLLCQWLSDSFHFTALVCLDGLPFSVQLVALRLYIRP